jgi:hypothetical protein
VPGVGVDPGVVVVPGLLLCPGAVLCPAVEPAEPAVCNAASIIPVGRRVDPVLDGEALVHWSATLVALATVNCLVAPGVAEPEFIPELEPVEVEVLAEAPVLELMLLAAPPS